MEACVVDPRQLRRAGSERRRRRADFAPHFGGEINRQEQTHVRACDLRRLVERSRAKSARVELDALVSRAEHRGREAGPARVGRPERELIQRQLDARQLAVMSHAKVARDAERAERGLGPLDAL